MAQSAQTTDINGQIAFLQALIDEGERTYDEQLLEAAPHDITAFSEYIEQDWVPARHHQVMLDKLQPVIYGENARVIVSMPVGHAKTTYSSLILPAFKFGQKPESKIITAGHTQNFVETAIARKVRGIITSERYKKVFPNTVLSNDSRASDYFTVVPTKGTLPGHYLARGVGGGISGFRAETILADDLYPNIESADSKAWRDKVISWWHGDLTTRILPGASIVLVCTRWHGDDIIGNLLDAMEAGGEKWETVIMSAVCDDPANDPLGRQEGEALWPEFHTIEKLMKEKQSKPPRIWNCLYQSNPIAEDGGIIKADWLNTWDRLPDEKMIRRRWVSFDTASTITERADFTVGTAWIETIDRRYYMVDVVRKRVEFNELVRMVDDFARRNQASAILVEDAGAGKSLIQSQQGRLYAPLIGMKTDNKSKSFRFDSVSPLFESGTVLFPKHHENMPDVTKELLEFPNGAKDDIVDSITHALIWSRGSAVNRGMKKLRGAA